MGDLRAELNADYEAMRARAAEQAEAEFQRWRAEQAGALAGEGMGRLPSPGEIYDQRRRAHDIADPAWPLRWRAGAVAYAELHGVTLGGEPAVKLSNTPGEPPRLLGLPLVRDRDAPRDYFEIEAKPGDVWVMVLRGKASHDGWATTTMYPVSPMQDGPRKASAWPYEDIPNGPRVWTDAHQAPLDGLVAPEALPRMPPEHSECLIPVFPKAPPVCALDADPLVLQQIETRHFRREQWRNGGDLVWLWRRVR